LSQRQLPCIINNRAKSDVVGVVIAGVVAAGVVAITIGVAKACPLEYSILNLKFLKNTFDAPIAMQQ